MPDPEQHVGRCVVAGFGEEELYDTVLVPGEAFDDVGREVPGAGDASAHERVGGGGQAAHGVGVVVQRHDPPERGAVAAWVDVGADACPLFLGEVGPGGHYGADVFVGILGKALDQGRVQIGVAGKRAALGRLTVACQAFGEAAFQAAGLQGAFLNVVGVEDRRGHRMVLVVPEQCLGTDLVGGVVQEPTPGRAAQVRPGPRAGRGPHGRVRVGGQGGHHP
ncbi:hypothetical protein OHS81_32790 [Streptomyces sp. NBC_00400]|uniref:hypothetical protein n=1 Tax=Streptomyces sp. NBC_00400 TaxID=2975737 RepID=UPI002E212211